MRLGFRHLAALILVTALTVAAGASTRADATTPSKSALVPGDPCTYLPASQVGKVFGGSVLIDRANPSRQFFRGTCSYDVGPTSQIGILTATLVYPILPPPGQTAIDFVEGNQASDAVLGTMLADAKVGKHGYFNLDTSKITVAASKKFAFSLQWVAAGSSSGGGTLGPRVQHQLVTLAKAVIARSPH